MSDIPKDCLYTKQHEWLRREGRTAAIGITQHAAEQLGDVTYVELPSVGQELKQGESLGVVESVKAVSDIYAPASGVVTEVNERLSAEPELVNEDPYGEGWICRIALADDSELDSLLTPAAYGELLAQ